MKVLTLAFYMLSNDLTPNQRGNVTYQLCYHNATHDHHLVTPKQHSWITAMLRKKLGDPKVTYSIVPHGIPVLLDAAVTQNSLDAAVPLRCSCSS